MKKVYEVTIVSIKFSGEYPIRLHITAKSVQDAAVKGLRLGLKKKQFGGGATVRSVEYLFTLDD